MRKIIAIILLYFTGCFLIPCLVTLAIGNRKERVVTTDKVDAPVIEEDQIIRAVATYYKEGDNKEFLKALAIVIRTCYSVDSDVAPKTSTYEELKEKWGTYYSANYEAVINAVKETKGMIISSDTDEVLPYFCEVSAGYTRGRDKTCLGMVSCSNDLTAPDYLSVVTYSANEVADKLKISGENILESFQVISRDEAGYVDMVMVGNLNISGDELSNTLGLNSSNFMVTTADNSITFTVKGVGNGYGMSLYSARIKAAEGAGYKEILLYYYKNISINE